MHTNLSSSLQGRLTADLHTVEGNRESDPFGTASTDPHPLCAQVRALRKAAGLSLAASLGILILLAPRA